MESAPARRHAGEMTNQPVAGPRLERRASDELALLRRELGKASKGRDTSVHKSRKAIQRLRCLLRLARETDPGWHARTDGQLRQLRRRLGPLRDAAVRAERVKAMLGDSGELDAAQRHSLEAAWSALRAARDAAWAKLPQDFWLRIDRAAARLLASFERWPLEQVSEDSIHLALEKARRRVRRKVGEVLGHVQRNARHDLRRLLRRYAAMRRGAAAILRLRDPAAAVLVGVAKDLGVEGDLWLTCTALRATAEAQHTRGLRSALEKERRALCKKHDGELASLRRGPLAREQAGHAARAKAARKAQRASLAEASTDADGAV